MKEGHSDYQVQDFVLWQAVAFRLPVAQQEASRWWDAPPWLSGLHPQDFMPITDASSPKDLWFMRQEKTLALAWVLQACTKESGAQQAFYAMPHESFRDVWPPDDPQQGQHS